MTRAWSSLRVSAGYAGSRMTGPSTGTGAMAASRAATATLIGSGASGLVGRPGSVDCLPAGLCRSSPPQEPTEGAHRPGDHGG